MAKCDLWGGQVYQRKQEPQESMDSFITSLHCLAEHCSYGGLYNEMIRDWIVVGQRDASIAQKLQMDPKLTLDKVVTLARSTKWSCKSQQSVVPPPAIDDSISIEEMKNSCLTNHKKPHKTRFYMRMMRFQCSITYVLGKVLTTADALSRAPLTQITSADEQLTMDSDIYVSAVLQNLPITDKCLYSRDTESPRAGCCVWNC